MATPLFVCKKKKQNKTKREKKKKKNGSYPEKRKELQAYNFGIHTQFNYANNMGWVQSMSPGEYHKHINMATPLSIFKNGPKWNYCLNKEWNFGRQTQVDLANNMGWVISGHAISPLCVRLKMSKMVLKKKKSLT